MIIISAIIAVLFVVAWLFVLRQLMLTTEERDKLRDKVERLTYDNERVRASNSSIQEVRTVIPLESVSAQAESVVDKSWGRFCVIRAAYEKMPAVIGEKGKPLLMIMTQDTTIKVPDTHLDDFVLGVNAAYKAARSTEANVTERVDKPS